jgi:signal transduction histidine kinase
MFSLADFLWFVGAPLPPVGAVLSIVFLFVLAESLIQSRLVDLYDMAGLALVSTTLAFSMAGIFYLCVVLLGGFQTMYLNAVLAGIMTIILFEPLRDKLDAYIHRAIFVERVDLERAVTRAKAELAQTLSIEAAAGVVVRALEDSRRATAAGLYLRDSLGADFELAGGFAAELPARLEAASLRTLLDYVSEQRSVDLQALERQLTHAPSELEVSAEATELLLVSAEVFGELRRGICVPVMGEQREVLGLIVLRDERLQDAFSSDDLLLLESLGLHVATVVANSRQHLKLQERARLAALGQMAAGLAHEIKNPLGAIKGAAQLLAEEVHEQGSSDEFVSIILEEVERLDRVVGSVLDYARPPPAQIGTIELSGIIERTLAVVRSSREYKTTFVSELDAGTLWVRADAEQLKQVLINLLRNGAQAMSGVGQIEVTARRRSRGNSHFIEVAITDHGPGISDMARGSLFVPFFTTKSTGTGLGLAITQRIVESMGGRIEVRSEPGVGATFTVVLPAAEEPVEESSARGTDEKLVAAIR